MMKVCLFDIDGTLLNTGGAGQTAMEEVLEKHFDITELDVQIHAAGRTDRAIVSDLFDQLNIEPTEENWNRFQNAYLDTLPAHMGNDSGRLLPGVIDLLNSLSELDNIHLGLLTGNFQRGAWSKLSHYSIDHHFGFGGFGDHHRNRDDVAKVAFEETQKHLDTSIEGDAVWVIGDTPADVQCGRAIGANVIAVSTGIYDSKTLADSNPDHLWDDLSNKNAMIDILMS